MKSAVLTLVVALVLAFVATMFLATALVPRVNAQAGEVVLKPTDDTYNDYMTHVHTNYGSAQELKTSLAFYHTWLKFNLSSIPEGAIGVTAVLELYTAYGGVTTPHYVWACYSLNCSWSESTLTAASEPYYDGIEMDMEEVWQSERWYEWNATEAVVTAAANRSSAVTILLRFPYGIEGASVSFTSKEGSMTKFPKLTVSWTAVPVDTTPPAIGTPGQDPPSAADQEQEVKVTVEITDADSGVKNATLLFTVDDGGSWEPPRSMDYNVTSGYYETAIPGQPDGTVVKYKVVAFDNAGNENTNDNAGEYYVYSVVPELFLPLALPLFMLATLLAIVCRRRHRFARASCT